MDMRATALAVLTAFVILSLPDQAGSATFTVLTGAPVGLTGCHFKLEGEIQSGDLTKLTVARAQLDQLIGKRLGNDASMADMFASHSPVLCLNSPGGNFAEGLRIAKF